MEAEQNSYYREFPVAFGQKREIVGVGQSDTANNTLCRYYFQVHPFLAKKAPGTPVFGHCPIINGIELQLPQHRHNSETLFSHPFPFRNTESVQPSP